MAGKSYSSSSPSSSSPFRDVPIGPMVHSLVHSFGQMVHSLVHSFGPMVHSSVHSFGPLVHPLVYSPHTCSAASTRHCLKGASHHLKNKKNVRTVCTTNTPQRSLIEKAIQYTREWTYERTDGPMNEPTNGPMDQRMNQRMDR